MGGRAAVAVMRRGDFFSRHKWLQAQSYRCSLIGAVMEATYGARTKTAINRKPVRTAKPKRSCRLRDARVGALLLTVMGFFAVLVAAVGALAVYFLQSNYESIRSIEDLTSRAKQVEIINSDMLRARVDLMVAARFQQESGWGSGEDATSGAKQALESAVTLLEDVRS